MAYWISRGKPSEAERSLTSFNGRYFDRNRRGRRVLYRLAREGRSARDIRTQTSGILAAEVVDLACAQATDAQPRLLHRLIRLRDPPQNILYATARRRLRCSSKSSASHA